MLVEVMLNLDRKVIAFITYMDEDNTIVKVRYFSRSQETTDCLKSRMTYASSRETLKNSLNGIGITIQANEPGELEWQSLVQVASKGKAAA